MANYEVLYILSPALSEEERESVIEKFKKFIEERDGVVGEINKWGMKTLAYSIKFKKEGFYILMNFKSPEQTSIDMGKLMLINESILRHMIIKK